MIPQNIVELVVFCKKGTTNLCRLFALKNPIGPNGLLKYAKNARISTDLGNPRIFCKKRGSFAFSTEQISYCDTPFLFYISLFLHDNTF